MPAITPNRPIGIQLDAAEHRRERRRREIRAALVWLAAYLGLVALATYAIWSRQPAAH